MSIIFSSVNIDAISFINSKNDMRFDFHESTISYNLCGSLSCKDILLLKLKNNFDSDEDRLLPYFICDVSALKLNSLEEIEEKFKQLNHDYSGMSENNEYYFVSFDGGDIDVKIICKSIDILKENSIDGN